jgi:predicted phosphate transport protein (TIGR00153 family)
LPISDIFSFLSSGERKTLERALAMLDNSIECAQHLLSLVLDLQKSNRDGANAEFQKIVDIERTVDDERRSLVRVICSGSFFGGIREDLLTLLERIDDISDAAKRSANIFHDMEVPQNVLDYFFQEDVGSFISTCISAAQLLKDAILALEKNKEEVLSIAEKVEKKEEEADGIHHQIVQHLYKNEIDAKSLDIVLLKDFLTIADDIADNAENGSDVLQILVAKGYS